MLVPNLFKKLLAISLLSTMIACEETATVSILSESEDFVQAASKVNNKIDILWVVDNSGSMGDEQAALAANFEAFINDLATKNYDFQIAVIGTDAYLGGDAAKYRNTSGYTILTPNTPDLNNAFIQNIMLGTGGYPIERGLASLEVALGDSDNQAHDFPRADSFFSVIIVSDETESVNPYPGHNHYKGLLDSIRAGAVLAGQQTYSINAIVKQAGNSCGSGYVGTIYSEIAVETGGIDGDICSDFSSSLTDITSSIVQLSTQFYLSRDPIIETIRVVVNEVEVPNNETNGWTYNSDSNSVIFNGTAIPSQGSSIVIDFDPVSLIN